MVLLPKLRNAIWQFILKFICMDQSRFCISYVREDSKRFNITSKYFSVFSSTPQASWVAHGTKNFTLLYFCSYRSSLLSMTSICSWLLCVVTVSKGRVYISYETLFNCNFIKKETLAQVFSCEFCEISKNTFLHKTPLIAASVQCFHIIHRRAIATRELSG